MSKGIISAGNWIIDHVKIIDRYPEQGNLVNVLENIKGTGGCPYNVLMDLARLNTGLPLFAGGVIGDDTDGKFIINDLIKNSIDTQFMHTTKDSPTSYTDVMTEKSTGARTFFHCRGANAILDVDHLLKIDAKATIFHLGYLLLLDKLDAADDRYGVTAARVLAELQKKGYKTSVDVVSEQSDRFSKVVKPCLPYINYLIINEIEAGQITGLNIREQDKINGGNLKAAAKMLLEEGVQDHVVIHFPEGGYVLSASGQETSQPSYKIKPAEIRGSVGAGDAFCAGVLYGLHENWPMDKSLSFGNAMARFNLLKTTSTAGARPLNEIVEYMENAALNTNIL